MKNRGHHFAAGVNRHEFAQVAAEPFVFEETAQGKALWKREHADLFAGVSRGIHQYYATGHNIHRENPKAVAEAIRFVAAGKTGSETVF